MTYSDITFEERFARVAEQILILAQIENPEAARQLAHGWITMDPEERTFKYPYLTDFITERGFKLR